MNKMKAVVYYEYGSPDVLTLDNIPVPQIRDNEVLVKVKYSGINPVDYKIRRGKMKFITGSSFPKIPGSDFSGEIVETGTKVTEFKKGDAVFGMTRVLGGGSCAEYVKTLPANIWHMPTGVDFREAGCVPLAALTALQALRDKGEISKGKKVLINGASGGVGLFAVQIAKLLGAEVTAVTSYRNNKLVGEFGPDHVIHYTEENFTDKFDKFDIIFDVVNRFSFAKAVKWLNPDGVYIMTSAHAGDIFSTLNPLYRKFKLRSVMVKPVQEDLKQLADWLETGKLKVHIDKVFELNDPGNAHIYSESGRVRGKTVFHV